MKRPTDSQVLDLIAAAHIELCVHLGFSAAGLAARRIIGKQRKGATLRDAVDEVLEVGELARSDLQGRLAVVWCQVMHGTVRWAHIESWMHAQSYSDEEVEHAKRRVLAE